MRFKQAVSLLVLIGMLVGGAAPILAQEGGGKILERVVASVDDEIILLSELLAELQILVIRTGKQPSREQVSEILENALESNIREKLLIAKAHRDDVQIGDDELERAMDQHIGRLQDQAGGEASFQRELEREGLTMRELRKKLSDPMRDQILVQQMLERLTYDLAVTDAEAQTFFSENSGNREIIPLRPEMLSLAHILVRPKPDQALSDAVDAKLERVRQRLAAGDDFALVAKELSEGPAAPRGGDMGTFSLGDIAIPAIAQALANLAAGELSDLVVSEQGLHLLKMEERQGNQVHFRQIFFSLPLGQADQDRARALAREALKGLQAGRAWDEVVAEYSDDELTRESGGELPPIGKEQLDERYRNVIDVLEAGEHSGVFLAGQGFEIVRLVARQAARPFEFDEIAQQIESELMGRKRAERLEGYVSALSDEIVIVRNGIPPIDEIAGLWEQP